MSRAIKKVVQNQSAWLCVSLLPFFLIACEDSPPGPPAASSIQLSVEDASCTEAWLKVTLTDANQPRTIALKRDGQIVLTAQITANDSILIDEGLLPNHAYTYQAVRMRDSVAIDASANVQATTLDTTSHNWSFEIDTLGDGNSSVLYDVAIINDSLAYAVGEIYLRDSTGQIDPQAYNMAKWNGVSWQLMRIQFFTICGQANRTPYPAKSVIAFSPSDVWIAMDGSQLARWNGTAQTTTICNPDPFVINKLWGENPNSLWAVGLGGRIGHYTNGTWQRIESGTSADMRDIWGCPLPDNTEKTILGIASSPGETRVLSLSAATAHDTLWWQITQRLRGLWMSNRFTVYVSGPGIWRNTGSGWRQMPEAPGTQFLTAVRGTSENNMLTVAWRGVLGHFNGASWHQYTEISTDINFEALAVSDNLMVAVGFTGGLFADRAGVVIGRRVP